MANIGFLLFWIPVAFGILVAGSYVGTTLALRSYFDDETVGAGDFIRIDDEA